MKILMVLTSHDRLGTNGGPTGYWLEEFAAPYFVFLDAGAEVTLASPRGGEPPIDPNSDGPEAQSQAVQRLKADPKALAALGATLPLRGLSAADFDAVFYPGGHGPLFDLVDSSASIQLTQTMLAAGKPAELRLEVEGAAAPGATAAPVQPPCYRFDPADVVPCPQAMPCPAFFPIIASDALARILAKKLPADHCAGWILEGPTAGGHNAPPRNKVVDANGDPIYDERDVVDLDVIAALGKPFYLAGGRGRPGQLRAALAAGAAGIQVGSLFSLACESGYPAAHKRRIIAGLHRGEITVRTDGRVSTTGFPFKVLQIEGTLGMPELCAQRVRVCDLGYLQTAFVDERGRVRGRCPGEPVDDYVRKGGARADTVGRGCLCNGLMANIGLGQRQAAGPELPLFTAGDGILQLALGSADEPRFSAADVIAWLRDGVEAPHESARG